MVSILFLEQPVLFFLLLLLFHRIYDDTFLADMTHYLTKPGLFERLQLSPKFGPLGNETMGPCGDGMPRGLRSTECVSITERVCRTFGANPLKYGAATPAVRTAAPQAPVVRLFGEPATAEESYASISPNRIKEIIIAVSQADMQVQCGIIRNVCIIVSLMDHRNHQ